MSFLLPFLNFLQPGIFIPALAPYRPMMVVFLACLAFGLTKNTRFVLGESYRSPAIRWITLFILMQAISVHFAGASVMLAELMNWLTYWLFVFVSCLLITDVRQMRRYVVGMIWGSMVVVVIGILSVPMKWGLAADTGRAGAYGMYQNHNDYSFIIIQIIPFVFMYSKLGGAVERWLLRVCLLACVAGIFLSLSRGGVLALVLEAVLIVIFGMEGRKRFWLLPIVAMVGLGAIGYQWAKRAENQQTGYTAETAQESREELWRAAEQIVKQRPFLGVGSRRFGEYAKLYYPLSHNQIGKNSHNTYIEIIATSGILGFTCFAFLIWRTLQSLWRRAPAGADPYLEATRLAALISIVSIIFRGLLDAKNEDWSYYLAVVMGIAVVSVSKRLVPSAAEPSAAQPQSQSPPPRSSPFGGGTLSGRPVVYGVGRK